MQNIETANGEILEGDLTRLEQLLPALLGPLFVVPAIALARFSGHFIYANLADLQRAFGIETKPLRRVRRRAPSRPRVQSLPSWDREPAPQIRGSNADRKIATPGPQPSPVTRRPAASSPQKKGQGQRPAQRPPQQRKQGTQRRKPAKNALQAKPKGVLGNHKHTPLR